MNISVEEAWLEKFFLIFPIGGQDFCSTFSRTTRPEGQAVICEDPNTPSPLRKYNSSQGIACCGTTIAVRTKFGNRRDAIEGNVARYRGRLQLLYCKLAIGLRAW